MAFLGGGGPPPERPERPDRPPGNPNSNPAAALFVKSRPRATLDGTTLLVNVLEDRLLHRDWRDRPSLQPHSAWSREMLLPEAAAPAAPADAYCARHLHSSLSVKLRCALHAVVFMPDKPRLITGSAAGQFNVWHTTTFHYDTVVQAHTRSIRAMRWNRGGEWLVSGDEAGTLKYWGTNLRPQEEFDGHGPAAVRGVSFAPSDRKFVTCSDDKSLRLWDFWGCAREGELTGHNAEVYTVSWHTSKSLIASGSRDATVKLWDPRGRKDVATLCVVWWAAAAARRENAAAAVPGRE